MEPRTLVGVIGASAPDQEEMALAEEVGARVAERGAALVCGGMGGVMEAASRGARSRGGLTIGVLPGNDRLSGNGWLDIAIATGMGDARNLLIVLSASGVIAIGGGFGTLSEIAYCLQHRVPLVGLRTWELKEEPLHPTGIPLARTPLEAVDWVFRRIPPEGMKEGRNGP